jgi:hypothetical protein
MTLSDIASFIDHWHAAIAENIAEDEDRVYLFRS